MTRNRRLEKLEEQTQANGPGFAALRALYDSDRNKVQAELITMPEHEVEGLAELPDGKQIPVVYDAYVIKVGPPEPPLDANKLYYRMRPGVVIDWSDMSKHKFYFPEDWDLDKII